MKLSTLSTSDLSMLTQVLQLRPDDSDSIHYANRIATLIEALPSRLKADGFLKRMVKPLEVEKSRIIDPLDQRGSLCPLHHKLNATIVRKSSRSSRWKRGIISTILHVIETY